MAQHQNTELMPDQLIAKIDRQSSIICELLLENQELRNRLRHFDKSAKPGHLQKIEAESAISRARSAPAG